MHTRFRSWVRFVVRVPLCVLLAGPLFAATATEGDYVIKNFTFTSGQSLPELRIHYHTIGKPVRDAKGMVRNAVLIGHGTGGSGDGFLARISDSPMIGVSPLSATPGQVQFRYVQGGPPLATQNVQLSGDSIPFTVSSDAAWVTVNPQTGVAPATLAIGAVRRTKLTEPLLLVRLRDLRSRLSAIGYRLIVKSAIMEAR